jgi:hypothetical protein
MVKRALASVFIAIAATGIAAGLGIPFWVDMPSATVPADACDIGVLIGLSVFLLNAPTIQQPRR